MPKKLTFRRTFPHLTQWQLKEVEELLSPLDPLPEDFREFLLKHNGGVPEPSDIDIGKGADRCETHICELYGVDVGPLAAPNLDCVRQTMRYRDELPRHTILIGDEYFDGYFVLYTWGDRDGEIWRWPGTDCEEPIAEMTFVAKTFTKFLGMIHRRNVDDPYEPVPIALDKPEVREKRLAAKLKSLGCTVWKYGRSKPDPSLPPAWRWAKYRNFNASSGTAFLSVEKNRTYGFAVKSPERPVGHPILMVSVTKDERKACLAELLKALGPGAVRLDTATGV